MTGLRRRLLVLMPRRAVQVSSSAVSTASLPREFEPTCVISSLENRVRGRVPAWCASH
jgi:hypothetical protein